MSKLDCDYCGGNGIDPEDLEMKKACPCCEFDEEEGEE
jgi:hypothetical protein